MLFSIFDSSYRVWTLITHLCKPGFAYYMLFAFVVLSVSYCSVFLTEVVGM